ncbi:MAG: hypothetical protein U0S12_03475 [Fimbriimonadales bacterium]
MILRRLLMLVCSAVLLAVAGCGGGGSNTTLPPDPQVMFVNVSPDSDPLDFLFDDDLLAKDVSYLTPPAAFRSYTPGDRDCTVIVNSEDPNSEALWSEAIGLNRDESYIVCSFGLQNFGDEYLKRLRIAILRTDRTSPNNSARIVIFHAYNRKSGFDTPTIDFQNPGQNPRYKQEGIVFGNRVELTVDAGTYTFVARRTSTEFEITPQVTKTFESGKIYLAVVSGVEDEVGAKAPQITFFEIPTKS